MCNMPTHKCPWAYFRQLFIEFYAQTNRKSIRIKTLDDIRNYNNLFFQYLCFYVPLLLFEDCCSCSYMKHSEMMYI